MKPCLWAHEICQTQKSRDASYFGRVATFLVQTRYIVSRFSIRAFRIARNISASQGCIFWGTTVVLIKNLASHPTAPSYLQHTCSNAHDIRLVASATHIRSDKKYQNTSNTAAWNVECRLWLMSHTHTHTYDICDIYDMTHSHVRHDSSTCLISMCDTAQHLDGCPQCRKFTMFLRSPHLPLWHPIVSGPFNCDFERWISLKEHLHHSFWPMLFSWTHPFFASINVLYQ